MGAVVFRLRKHARRPSRSLLRRLERLSRKKVSGLTEKDVELLVKYNFLRSRRALTLDFRREGHIPKYVGTWLKHPGRYDIPGVDTPSSPQAVEVFEEARKRKERREARKKALGGHGSRAKHGSGLAEIEELGALTTNSRHGKLYVYSREEAQSLKKLYDIANYQSFMYIDGTKAGFMGMAPDRTIAFSIRVEGAEGNVWPLSLFDLPLTKLEGGSEVIITPSRKKRYVKITVLDKNKKKRLTIEVPQLRAKDVKEMLRLIKGLSELMWKPKYLEIEINDAKVLQRLRKALRKGYDVELSPNGIRVYAENRKYSFKSDWGMIVTKYEEGEPVYIGSELLMHALPQDPHAQVKITVPKVEGMPGPVIVEWGDGTAVATYFIAPRVSAPEKMEPRDIEHEVLIPPDVMSELVNVPDIRKKYGKVNAYLSRNYFYVVDDGNTAVLAVKLSDKLSIPKDKVIKIEDMKALKDILINGVVKLVIVKGGTVWAVNDKGDSAIIGELIGLNNISVSSIVENMEEEGLDKFMKRVASYSDEGEIKRDALLKSVRRKFNILRIRKTAADDAVIELVEESRDGNEKLVCTLGKVKNATYVDKDFSIGKSYASVKPWLEAFSKLSKNYAVDVKVKNDVIVMHSGNTWFAMTSGYS